MEDRPSDQEILNYERQIKQEMVGKDPLVSKKINFDLLVKIGFLITF